jgi:hypothetical protein
MSDPAGDGHNGPTREDFLKAVAIAEQDDADLDAIKARRSRNRKKFKAQNIELGDLDQVRKMLGWTIGEIRTYFTRKLKYLGFVNIKVGTQFDLFSEAQPTGATEDVRWAGNFAGLKGLKASPPPSLSPAQVQLWMEGWGEGDKARAEALAEAAAEALKADTVQSEADRLQPGTPPGASPHQLGDAEGGDYGEEPSNVVPLTPSLAEERAKEQAEIDRAAAALGAKKPRARKGAAVN